MKTLHRSILEKLTGLVGIMLISGCTSMSQNLVTDGELTVDRVHSRVARIAHVHVRSDNSKLRVSGEIRKAYHGRGRIPGHFHIEVFSDNGELLIQTTSRYRRLNGKSQVSRFSEMVPVLPSQVTKVRVTNHELRDKL